MSASVQGMRTFGEKPKAFQIEDGGELYYVGSEVMNDLALLSQVVRDVELQQMDCGYCTRSVMHFFYIVNEYGALHHAVFQGTWRCECEFSNVHSPHRALVVTAPCSQHCGSSRSVRTLMG